MAQNDENIIAVEVNKRPMHKTATMANEM